jgi:glycosyltransferase involved in cell wall biosynthesis
MTYGYNLFDYFLDKPEGRNQMKNTIKIWIISEYFYPVMTSTGFYMTEIAKHFKAYGFNVNIICANSYYKSVKKSSLIKCENWNGIHIERLLVAPYNSKKLLIRLFMQILISFRMFLKMIRCINSHDYVFVVTNPAFILIFMGFLRWMKGIKYSVIVHDIFPENLATIGSMSKKSIIYKFALQIFNFGYSNARDLIALGRDMIDVLQKKTSGRDIRYHLIPNWSDVEDVNPSAKSINSYIKKYRINKPLILQFAGNLGRAQNIDLILKIAEEVNNPDLVFVFIGCGVKEVDIKKHIRESKRKNVNFWGYIDRNMQNEFLNACDISIVTLQDGMYGLGVPSKSYNIMAAGKPILYIGDENSEISLMVKENDIGWSFNGKEPIKIIEFLTTIKDDPFVIRKKGIRARALAEKEYSKKVILDKYIKILDYNSQNELMGIYPKGFN